MIPWRFRDTSNQRTQTHNTPTTNTMFEKDIYEVSVYLAEYSQIFSFDMQTCIEIGSF